MNMDTRGHQSCEDEPIQHFCESRLAVAFGSLAVSEMVHMRNVLMHQKSFAILKIHHGLSMICFKTIVTWSGLPFCDGHPPA